MRRLSLIFLSLWLAPGPAATQPPQGYYNPADGLTGKALQQALHDIIDEHTVIAYDDLYSCFLATDIKPDNVVWDMYSDVPGGTPAYIYHYGSGQECGNYNSEADCFNREHSFPKSWFGDIPPMNSDLFHIYPTDGYVNNRRSNYPFGETVSATWISTNGSKVGPSSVSGYTGLVFEPIDEYKGDFARTYFYMATRYYGDDGLWPGSDMTDGAQPKQWALDMLLAWHRNDIVSTKEIDRNNEVYKYQNNRNPFIDDPDFAEKIWGTLNPIEDTYEERISLTLFPNPAQNYLYIRTDGNICSGTIVYVYDAGGCLIMAFALDDTPAAISTGGLGAGIYYIRLACEDQVLNQAFVIVPE
jgi:endonuclease I